MKKNIYFVADLFESDLAGGAEIVNEHLIHLLANKGYIVEKTYSRVLTCTMVKAMREVPIIIGSFVSMREDVKRELATGDYNYIIYEHDHKYLPSRNPGEYKDYIVPSNIIVNRGLYENADLVLCQSTHHQEIINKNLNLSNTFNLGSSLWSLDELNELSKLDISKNKKAAIVASDNPVKNQAACEKYCKSKNIPYEIIQADNSLHLAKKLAEYEYLVFFPTVPESLCRVAVEAKMVGCKVITNKMLGASSEPWFRGSSHEIIEEMRQAPKKTLDVIEGAFQKRVSREPTHFKVIVPFYNAEDWIQKCLISVRNQQYTNFQCIIVNDASSDNSEEKIKEVITGDDRFVYLSNQNNVGALENIYNAIEHSQPDPEDVIITLDGDDWLANQAALSLINNSYLVENCWMTYGSYIEYPAGVAGKFSKKSVPPHVISSKSYRETEWMTSALRTFKYFLWEQIKPEDLKNKDGNFYEAAWDLAFMFPMLEMAGPKIHHVKDYVYVYNLDTPINDHKVPEKREKQLRYEKEIRAKKKYSTFFTEVPKRKLSTSKEGHYVVNSPLSLLTPFRMDVAAKTLYGRHKSKGIDKGWAYEVYSKHLEVWGGHKEINPPKNGIDEFCNSYQETYQSIKENGFCEEQSYIPTAPDNSPLNGAHRLASAILCNEPVICKHADISEGQYDCSYNYFSTKTDIVKEGLSSQYTDAMVREYVKLKKGQGLYMATLYDHCNGYHDKISQIFSKNNVKVVAARNAALPKQGQLNYIVMLYGKEPWLGNIYNDYPGAYEQAAVNFEKGDGLVFCLLEGSLDDVTKSKNEIREIIGVGKRSLHTTDTPEEVIRNTYTAFHVNTLAFLTYAKTGYFNSPVFSSFIKETKNIMEMNQMDTEDFCVGGSATLAAYGIRECKDFDIVHTNPDRPLGFSENVTSHNAYLKFYPHGLENILHHPKNHIYIDGIKFLSMENTIGFKNNRGEDKDIKDVNLARQYAEELGLI